MHRVKKIASRLLIAVLLTVALTTDAAFGLVNYEHDPNLSKAMEYDGEMNGGDIEKSEREMAVRYYLKYLDHAKDSFQKANVYCQLGALYTVGFNRRKGETPDYAKGREYYKKVLECEPERIGRATIVARNMLVSLDTPKGLERIKARMDMYEWLAGIDKARIRREWLPETPAEEKALSDPNAWLKDPNRLKYINGSEPNKVTARFLKDWAFRERTEGRMLGIERLIADLKEVHISNAAYHANVCEDPEGAFAHILSRIPADRAKERQLVEDAKLETSKMRRRN